MEYNHSNDIMQSNVQELIKTLLFALYYPMFSLILFTEGPLYQQWAGYLVTMYVEDSGQVDAQRLAPAGLSISPTVGVHQAVGTPLQQHWHSGLREGNEDSEGSEDLSPDEDSDIQAEVLASHKQQLRHCSSLKF